MTLRYLYDGPAVAFSIPEHKVWRCPLCCRLIGVRYLYIPVCGVCQVDTELVTDPASEALWRLGGNYTMVPP
jgi:hypothetical protein